MPKQNGYYAPPLWDRVAMITLSILFIVATFQIAAKEPYSEGSCDGKVLLQDNLESLGYAKILEARVLTGHLSQRWVNSDTMSEIIVYVDGGISCIRYSTKYREGTFDVAWSDVIGLKFKSSNSNSSHRGPK